MKRDIGYIRASASLPYVSKFVELDGRKLLDGGCTDSVPVEAFRRLGYKRNVVVLTRDSEYRKKPENTWMADIVYHKYPKFAEALKNRAVEVQHAVSVISKSWKRAGEDLRDPSERSSYDPEDLQERRGDRKTYQIGVMDAKKMMADLRKWLETSEGSEG
ncbi:MAG: patatin-like phospholipase family protein [Pilosibacter sp.]